jgi:hypothetical protein
VITLSKNINYPIEIEKLRSDVDKYRLNLKRDGYATPAPSWLRWIVSLWVLSVSHLARWGWPGHPKVTPNFFVFFSFFKKIK